MAIEVHVGMESIRNYKRLSYQVWYALAEFVDNSTQSYFNNRNALDSAYKAENKKLNVRVVYARDENLIRVTDNAMGMDLEDLEKALQIAVPPANSAGRSEFGLGLKTAACWLGDYWTVRTKKLGEEYEYEVHFDVEKVATGETTLEPKAISRQADLHYTVVEVKQMHQKLAGRTIGKTKEILGSMYRIDVRDDVMDLWWDQEALSYDDSLDILKAADGTSYVKDVDFKVGDKSVTGWVAVLKSGGRPKAGFAAIRRGRVIEGQPAAWRPRSIFGQEQGTNNLVNQRVVGEIHLDEFMVSHTKNAILWQGTEEEDVEEGLKRQAADYIYVASQTRKGDKPASGPNAVEIDAAVDELKSEMESPEFIDMIVIDDVPPPEVATARMEPVVKSTEGETANVDVQVGDDRIRVFLSDDTSPNDPYFAADYAADLVVVINTNHPHWQNLSGSEGVANYLRHCVYDALAEWKLTKRTGQIHPDTAKLVKDGFLRLKLTGL